MTPLVVAGWRHDADTIALLRELGAQIYNLREAAIIGEEETIRRMVRSGQNVNATDERGNTSLMIAAIAGRLESIRVLIECDADISLRNPEGYTAHKWALLRDQHEAAELLVQYENQDLVQSALEESV